LPLLPLLSFFEILAFIQDSFLRFTNHEQHNHDALFALTKLPAALFLQRKTYGTFSHPESLSIGMELVSGERLLDQL
jgi:hypothetical protein